MTAAKPTYLELMRDPRWQKKRLEIMERAKWACEECGETKITFNVHHTAYRKGAKPWEYENHELVCLCENCHEASHHLRSALNAAISVMHLVDLERLLGYAEALVALDLGHPDLSKLPISVRSQGHAEGLMDAFWNWNSGADRPTAECLVDHRRIDDDLMCMLGEGEMPTPDWKDQH